MSETLLNHKWRRFTPRVPEKYLLLLAGALWAAVGIMLNWRASQWLNQAGKLQILGIALVGVVFALIIHRFGFVRIANRNIDRIGPCQGKRCAFSFMPWKSYFTILIMVCLGLSLRHSSLPKLYLSVIYIAIGTALFLSSLRYIKVFLKKA